jgi:AbrB family looped-hinge helix DNA binding protein
MASATITSKGQITLPKAIRERLGVKPGDRVDFREREDGTIVVQPETLDLLSLRGALKPRTKGVTIEHMNEAVRRAANRR